MKMPNQDRSKEPSLYIVILKISRQIPIINFGIQTNGQELELQIIYDFELFYREGVVRETLAYLKDKKLHALKKNQQILEREIRTYMDSDKMEDFFTKKNSISMQNE